MKQRKKSFGMRISAFVLSFAMVCTLLAGVNVVAFAADEATSVSISKFYNDASKGGDGEHLFTKDADEISWLSSLPTWNNEGEAWKAPVSSNTTVFRCYNPTSGEHLYVDEGYADYLAGIGWNKEKLAFYSDDAKTVPVYRLWNGAEGVGSHHYTTDAGEVDWLVGQGWTKEDVAFYGVKEEANVVALTDINGFQADGTALKGDVLAVVFGSTFGTPASIAWYRDGAVVKVIPSRIDADALLYYTGGNALSGDTPGTGVYYAVVENTKGQSFTTNPITVVDEGVAVISDASINDNMGAVTNIAADKDKFLTEMALLPTVDKTTQTQIVNFKLNREYDDATVYLVKDDDDYTPTLADKVAFDTDDTSATYNTKIVNAKNFTDEYLSDAYAESNGDVNALKLENNDGSVQYKFITGMEAITLTRGDSYKVIYDQDGTATTKKVSELNASAAMTSPYLPTPTSVKVTGVQANTTTPGWTLTAYTGDIQAGWITDQALAKVKADLFTNDEEESTDGTPFTTDVSAMVMGEANQGVGVPNTTASLNNEPYVYGTFSAEKGIFGPEAISLTSDVVATPDNIADGITLTQSSTNPRNFEISISKLRAGATAFLIGGDANTTALDYVDALKDDMEFVAMAHLDKGTTSYTFENAVTEFDNDVDPELTGDWYGVVLVPDDMDEYAMVSDLNNPAIIQQNSMYRIIGNTTNMATTGADINVTNAFRAVDQFGNDMDFDSGDPLSAVLAAGINPELTTKASDLDQDQIDLIQVTDNVISGDGDLTIDVNIANWSKINAGDVYTFKLTPIQTLQLTVTKVDITGGTPTATLTLKLV